MAVPATPRRAVATPVRTTMTPRTGRAHTPGALDLHSSVLCTGGVSRHVVYDKCAERHRRFYGQPVHVPAMTLPSPADMRLRSALGQGCVFPHSVDYSRSAEARRHHDSAIPEEFWRTQTNLSWADPRNEKIRSHQAAEYVGVAGYPEYRPNRVYELSSELFGWTRQLRPSTLEPSREIRAQGDADFLGGAAPGRGLTRGVRLPPEVRTPLETPREAATPRTTPSGFAPPARGVRAKAADVATWNWLDSRPAGRSLPERTAAPSAVVRRQTAPAHNLLATAPAGTRFGIMRLDTAESVTSHETRETRQTNETLQTRETRESRETRDEAAGCSASWLDTGSEIVRRRHFRDYGRDDSANCRKQADMRSSIFPKEEEPARVRKKPAAFPSPSEQLAQLNGELSAHPARTPRTSTTPRR